MREHEFVATHQGTAATATLTPHGLWITPDGNPENGVCVYAVCGANGEMAIGVRRGTGTLGAALTVDIQGVGCLQLRKLDGSFITVTADDLAKLLAPPPCPC